MNVRKPILLVVVLTLCLMGLTSPVVAQTDEPVPEPPENPVEQDDGQENETATGQDGQEPRADSGQRIGTVEVLGWTETQNGLVVRVHSDFRQEISTVSAWEDDGWRSETAVLERGTNRVLIPYSGADAYGIEDSRGTGAFFYQPNGDLNLFPTSLSPRVTWLAGLITVFTGLLMKAKKKKTEERTKQVRIA